MGSFAQSTLDSTFPYLGDIRKRGGRVNAGFYECFEGSLDGDLVALHRPIMLNGTPAAQKRFRQEVERWKSIRHDNIPDFLGTTVIDDQVFLVTPWMTRRDITKFLEREADVVSLLRDVASGLEYLHQIGIVHGDLRGATITIDASGRALLSAFGLAGLIQEFHGSWLTTFREFCNWLAPELLDPRNDLTPTPRSDIWSFGMLCLELCTGDKPFPNLATSDQVFAAINNRGHLRRPEDPSLTDQLWTIMKSCWEIDPSRRSPISKIKKDLHPPSPSHLSPLARSLSRFSTSKLLARAPSSSRSSRAALSSLDLFDNQGPPASSSSDGGSTRVTWFDWGRPKSEVRSQYVRPSSHHSEPYPNEALRRENNKVKTPMTDKALPEIPETTSPVVSNEPPRELRINFELDGRTVVAGTVEDSIRFLVSTRHDIFRTLFIQSFPLFTTAPELFSLFDRLLESSSGGRRIGIRALRQDWLHVLDASDIAQIRSSPQSHTGTARSPFSEEVEVFMASRSQPSPTFSRSSLGSGKVSRPSSDSLAAALTTLEAELFSRVTYVDCMTYLRDSPSTVPSNIREILETRIKIKDWVIITVLQARDASSGTESSSARAAMYRFFVQIALRCHKIGNFSSAFAIAGALHSHYFNSLPITRPQARWRSDGQKRLEELYTLAAYRKALEKWNGPCIPVLDTYLREWTTSFKPSHIQKVDDEGFSWVDYRRCAEIRSAMGSILRYRHHLPNVRGGHDPDTMHYLDSRLNRNWETIDLDKMGKAYEEKEHEEDKHRSVGYPSKPR